MQDDFILTRKERHRMSVFTSFLQKFADIEKIAVAYTLFTKIQRNSHTLQEKNVLLCYSNKKMQTNNFLLDDEITEILLTDRTTGKNIIWATDNYKKYGERYNPEKQITLDLLVQNGENIIKPRVEKSKKEQDVRIKQKAEVFTPSWICNTQNNLVDDAWFGKKGTFNLQDAANHTWKTTKEKIVFPGTEGKTWKDFVKRTMLELTCGEAPYITSRYDSVSGSFIDVSNRIGFLDRKLRVVGENTSTKEEWLEWAENALKSTYALTIF